MLKYFWKNKIALLLLILSLFLVPISIGIPEQNKAEAIVTAVGVDKAEDEYEVTLQFIAPQSNGGEGNLKTATQKGKTVADAIEKLNFQLGKLTGFAHCKFLVFNEKASESNLTQILDFFLRKKTNTNNIALICTTKDSKDLLDISNNLDSDLYSFINNNGYSNELKDFQNIKTLGDFYKAYFSPIKCTFVNIVDTKENSSSGSQSGSSGGGSQASSSEGQGESSSGQEGGSSGGSSGSAQKEIENSSKLLILKDAKKLLALTKEQSDCLNWFNPQVVKDKITISNFTDDSLKNAQVTLRVENKKTNRMVDFKNGVPHFLLKIKLYVTVSQVIADELTQNDYDVMQKRLSDNILLQAQKEVERELKQGEENFKQNNYDVIDCYNLFYKFKNKQLKVFEKNISKEDFIKNVVFDYKVEVLEKT